MLQVVVSNYKVDTDAITAKVKQEFAAKEKAKATRKDTPTQPAKICKKAAAA